MIINSKYFWQLFQVSIGSTVSCSCGIIQNDHCIHSLYVLLKKFKVPPTNPIIWQGIYYLIKHRT